MKGIAHLNRSAKQNVKNLFKSQPTLIFAIDVCLRGGPSHLETPEIKLYGQKDRSQLPRAGEHEKSSKAQNQVRSKDSSSKKGTMVHKAPICQSPVEFSADAKDKAQGATTWGAGAKTPPPLRRKPHMTTPCESQRIRKTSAPQSEMSSQIGCQRRFLVERVKILIFPEKSDSLTTSSSLGMRLPAFKV
nr:uncharacterized protein LOC112425743 [Macaca nemestrina]